MRIPAPRKQLSFRKNNFQPLHSVPEKTFRDCDGSPALEYWAQISKGLGRRVRSGALGVQVLWLCTKFGVGSYLTEFIY